MKFLPGIIFLISCLVCCSQADARVWYYGTGLDGQKKEFIGSIDMHSKFINSVKKDEDYWQRILNKMERLIVEVTAKVEAVAPGIKRNERLDDLYKLKNNKDFPGLLKSWKI